MDEVVRLVAVVCVNSDHPRRTDAGKELRREAMINRCLGLMLGLTVSGIGIAGDHNYLAAPVYSNSFVSYHGVAVMPMAAPAGFYGPSYPFPVAHVAPVTFAPPVISYQRAYVVPMASYPPGYMYAPMVPVYSTPRYPVGGYYPPSRPFAIQPGFDRHGRPRDVEVELKYRRDGGYRYKVDFD